MRKDFRITEDAEYIENTKIELVCQYIKINSETTEDTEDAEELLNLTLLTNLSNE